MGGLSWKGRGLSIDGGLARRALAVLLPQDCLLCGESAAASLLCRPCTESLPLLSEFRCAVCALPTPKGEVCGECLKRPPHFERTCCALAYDFPADRLIQSLKYRHKLAVAEFLAVCMLESALPEGDFLLPVPIAPARLRERGFNQALEIARPLARRLGLPMMLDGCLRTLDTAPQAGLSWQERRRNVRHAFECRIDLSGKRVIVVDDVMTTGATLNELAATLKLHGAASVTNWVAARTVRH